MRAIAIVAALVCGAAGCSFDGASPGGDPPDATTVDAQPLADAAISDAVLPACASQFNDFALGTSSYRIITDLGIYDSAVVACASVEGGRLAIIEDSFEFERIEQELDQRSVRDAWIGLRQNLPADEPRGDWVWTDGAPHAPADFGWAFGEPNNFFFAEHCAEQVVDDFSGGWNDADCGKLNEAVCECDLSP